MNAPYVADPPELFINENTKKKKTERSAPTPEGGQTLSGNKRKL